jgi:tetratricopeptide (TPR) repeat protein/type II secretory pathway predicted ATPase ExeA
MQTITIAQKNITEAGFEATLTIEGSEFEITVCDPFGLDGREKALEWYFEEWIRFPFTGTVAATDAAGSVKDYGVALFEQVFGDRRAFVAYRDVAGNLGDVEFVIVGDPGFQALHWEAMWEKDRPRPLAVDAVMVRRRRVKNGLAKVVRQDSTVLNLLVVTSRPNEEKDVGYRTISRPLVEAIETANLPVNVEFVRPGTYAAFVRQLEDRGAGYYHMVHFDMHGGLMSFEQFRGFQPVGGDYAFQRGYDLPSLAEYEGVQAFLFFEGDEAGVAVPVTAQEMSDRLSTFGISACVLNACQSGKQVGSPLTPNSGGTGDGEGVVDVRETSLGARLMDAGMQMVVAMAYSVTVDAARVLVTRLYGELFGSVGLDRALQKSRSELYARKERSVYFGQKVDLEDWLLPVVYRNRLVDLKLRRMYPEEETKYFTEKALRFQFGNHFSTEYGFVGRDLEILKVEKGLIRDGNILMLYGMGGTGKTTLLRYLQDWWVQTGFVVGVSYFGYDQRAWNLSQILFGIAKDVMTEVELRSFQAMPQVAQVGKLAQVLKTRRWLVVLDNLESVTGQTLAIANTLTTAEQEEIRSFLMMVRGGLSRVLLGSRRRETWLASVYGGNEYELRGLDGQARSQLAQAVLKKHVKDAGKRKAILADKDFDRLMKLLAGYPLAIEVVLANLGRQSVEQVLVGLDGADVKLDRSGSKTESILQCVEYSHGNLSVAAQRSLLCLALFSGFLIRNTLGIYVEHLQAAGDAFGDLTLEALDGAVGEAIAWGLLTPMDVDNPHLLTIQPVFPYFLKTKLAQEDGAFCEALRLGFKNHYEGLAGYYKQMMGSKEAQEKQLGVMFCQLEYENLYAALQIALERQEDFTIFRCLDEYLKATGDFRQRLELCDGVCELTTNYPLDRISDQIALQIIETYLKLGNCHIQFKDYAAAKTAYLEGIQRAEKLSTIDKSTQQGSIATLYHQLGIVAQALREYDQARKDYQQALQIFIEFGDRYSQAITYHELGIVAQDLREYDQARKDYQQALQIKIEFGDRYSQAITYHELGMVAQKLREYDQARKDYQQALQIKIEFGDRYSQASTYGQLGILAQELHEYDQARKDYQQALQIYIEFGDRYSQASTYHQLGMVAQDLREFEQARNDYQQALQIYIEFGDRYEQAGTYGQLGLLAEAEEKPEEAIQNLLKALEIFSEFQDNHSVTMVFQIISRIYKSHPSPQFLSQIAQTLGGSEAEVLQLFETIG